MLFILKYGKHAKYAAISPKTHIPNILLAILEPDMGSCPGAAYDLKILLNAVQDENYKK